MQRLEVEGPKILCGSLVSRAWRTGDDIWVGRIKYYLFPPELFVGSGSTRP